MVQKRTLLSKFLHHSITIDPQNDIKNNMFHNEPSPVSLSKKIKILPLYYNS